MTFSLLGSFSIWLVLSLIKSYMVYNQQDRSTQGEKRNEDGESKRRFFNWLKPHVSLTMNWYFKPCFPLPIPRKKWEKGQNHVTVCVYTYIMYVKEVPDLSKHSSVCLVVCPCLSFNDYGSHVVNPRDEALYPHVELRTTPPGSFRIQPCQWA